MEKSSSEQTLEEDARLQQDGLCRVTNVDISGREWMCRRPVHAKLYRRRNGQTVYDSNPTADKHWFIPRYPYRDMKETS